MDLEHFWDMIPENTKKTFDVTKEIFDSKVKSLKDLEKHYNYWMQGLQYQRMLAENETFPEDLCRISVDKKGSFILPMTLSNMKYHILYNITFSK